MRIRALIVDDEPPARELIAALLRQEADVEIVGECANGRSALSAIEQLAPNLVFLDVRMPGIDGFGVLAALPPERWPVVIFVTAHGEHAVKAFELHALDYLLKPFEYSRLRESVRRARAKLEGDNHADERKRLVELLESLQDKPRGWDRIAARDAGRVTFIKPEEIDWVEADGNYVRLHAGPKSHLIRETMASAEERFGSRGFVRISRSALVNLERVREWQPLFHGDSVLILNDGTRLTVSRVYRDKFDEVAGRLG